LAKPVWLSQGDFVVLPRGDPHLMRDMPTSQVVDFFDLVKRHTPNAKKVFRASGRGPVTRLVCGGMRFLHGATDPLLSALPPLIHVQRRAGRPTFWLQANVVQILKELGSDRPGAEAVVTRLAEILFIQAVRGYFEENADRVGAGWLAAFQNNQVGRALALLHAEPTKEWTISSLANAVAMSRSVFAAKFSRLVGESPLRYLTRLRLNNAALRLHSTEDKLTTVAAAAGYDSVAAFARAFKRHIGTTPGEYRKGRTQGSSA
jgi:AraC-like DNA-binding protein